MDPDYIAAALPLTGMIDLNRDVIIDGRCGRYRFVSKEHAELELKVRKGRKKYSVYPCAYCGGWHLAKARK